jgi:hypothetical protein
MVFSDVMQCRMAYRLLVLCKEPVMPISRVGDLNMKFHQNADTYLHSVTIFITLVITDNNNYMLELNL